MFKSKGTSTRVPNLKGSQAAPPTQYQMPKAHEQQVPSSSGGDGLSNPVPTTGTWNKQNQQKPYYKPPGPAAGQKGGPKATGISYPNYR